jgi:dUTP pyrophosphatase
MHTHTQGRPVAIDLAERSLAQPLAPQLALQRLSSRATLPAYQTSGSAGLDLAACLPEASPTLAIAPGQIVVVPTGWALAIPQGFEGQVRPRSGLATKHGISVPNAPGTIDSDYRGELRVALINFSQVPFVLEHGMRMAQLVIAPVAQALVAEVSHLSSTQRASGGFGSTGLA